MYLGLRCCSRFDVSRGLRMLLVPLLLPGLLGFHLLQRPPQAPLPRVRVRPIGALLLLGDRILLKDHLLLAVPVLRGLEIETDLAAQVASVGSVEPLGLGS